MKYNFSWIHDGTSIHDVAVTFDLSSFIVVTNTGSYTCLVGNAAGVGRADISIGGGAGDEMMHVAEDEEGKLQVFRHGSIMFVAGIPVQNINAVENVLWSMQPLAACESMTSIIIIA